VSAIEIQQMPRREKLRLMEALWADLSRDELEVESPAWHADALRETSERLARGEEKILDWEYAKAKLSVNQKCFLSPRLRTSFSRDTH
jgi:hypothetical protein